jgi:hypothetical protein
MIHFLREEVFAGVVVSGAKNESAALLLSLESSAIGVLSSVMSSNLSVVGSPSDYPA